MDFIAKLLRHELISGSFYIFLGSMFANVLAFILNLFLARNLSYVDYGIFASLLSVITLMSIPSVSITTIVVKFAAAFYSKGEIDKVTSFYRSSFKAIFLFSVCILMGFTLFSPIFNNFLHFSNPWYSIIVGFSVVLFYFSALNTAFLQSLMKFAFISFMNFSGGIIKLIVGILLVYLGFKEFGGLWSIFFMMLTMFLIAYVPLFKTLSLTKFTKKVSINKKEIFKFAVPAFVTIFFLTSFTSTDVLLVKHFFNPHLAGFYAGLSLVGKVIFYFTAPIPMVMFPLLVKRHATGTRFVNLFYLALILVLIPSIAITVVYFVRPELIINIFLGGREYLYLSNYLGIFGLYLTVFSLVNVCVNLFLSLNKTIIFIPVVIAAIFQIILIYFYHSSFYDVIYISLAVTSLLFVVLVGMFFGEYKNFTKIGKNSAFLPNPGV